MHPFCVHWAVYSDLLESETSCFALTNLTFTKCEEPGYGISQYPCVSTELEQVIRENVGKSEAEPGREKSAQARLSKLAFGFC